MAIRAEIGIVFQDSVLDKLLTVRENLMLRGSFYGMKRSALENAAKAAAEAADVTDFFRPSLRKAVRRAAEAGGYCAGTDSYAAAFVSRRTDDRA